MHTLRSFLVWQLLTDSCQPQGTLTGQGAGPGASLRGATKASSQVYKRQSSGPVRVPLSRPSADIRVGQGSAPPLVSPRPESCLSSTLQPLHSVDPDTPGFTDFPPEFPWPGTGTVFLHLDNSRARSCLLWESHTTASPEPSHPQVPLILLCYTNQHTGLCAGGIC